MGTALQYIQSMAPDLAERYLRLSRERRELLYRYLRLYREGGTYTTQDPEAQVLTTPPLHPFWLEAIEALCQEQDLLYCISGDPASRALRNTKQEVAVSVPTSQSEPLSCSQSEPLSCTAALLLFALVVVSIVMLVEWKSKAL